MHRLSPHSLFVPLLLLLGSQSARATEGFYKDLFIDGGCNLTSRQTLPAADTLGLSVEALFVPSDCTEQDRQIQRSVITGDEVDSNGRLLYPDGAPRFRTIQVNGGAATAHGTTLGEDGRQRVRDFYHGGGSYTGTCAGFFIATVAAFEEGVNQSYFRIWPGRSKNTGLLDAYTGLFIEATSPLLEYSDFGGDLYVADVRHNGGGYAEESHPEWPVGTEILARYDYTGRSMHQQVSCLAYKADEQSGRLVIIGSHPEGITSGERLDLMAAMISYALDGQGEPQVKGELEHGVWRVMDRWWEDDDPAFTRIGDRQVHHFQLDVPWGATELTVNLQGEEGFDLDLYAALGGLAFASTADAASTSPGAEELIGIVDPEAGTWYVGVECLTTVASTVGDGYHVYSGNLDVLDGVAYSIRAELEIERYLALELPQEVWEGGAAATGRVIAYPAPPHEVLIALESSHPDRLEFADHLPLTAGQDSRLFEISPVDDGEARGDVELTVTACAPEYECASGTLMLRDDELEPPPLSDCGELGGTCCSSGQICQGGGWQESSDCPTACCVGGSCQDGSAEAGEGDMSPDFDSGGALETGEAGTMERTSSVGCACHQGDPGAPWPGWYLLPLALLLLRRWLLRLPSPW
ncbi:MAG: pre-peptidase C-terminal domain-containing protein [Bradymonadales bacterium]|nr:pre-peptidase C-terminal domain-containing protein [Bradymonadales bacterium]